MSRQITLSSAISLLIAVSAAPTQVVSQQLRAPQALLKTLDEEDRNCVIQGGGLSKAVTVQRIRLGSGGSQQLLIRGSGFCLCGAQNCAFWIYRKNGSGYELLLKGAGSTKVTAAQHRSKGQRDVVAESHAAANETIIRTYRFDGRQYQLQSCVRRVYYDDKGNQTKLPVYHPCE